MTTRFKAHVGAVLGWSAPAPVPVTAMAAAAVAMAVPALIGAVSGHLPAGLAAAVGAMGTAGAVADGPPSTRWTEAALAVLSVTGAAGLAALLAGHGAASGAATAAAAGLAALFGSLSRPLAVAATRFALFLVIVGAMMTATGGSHSTAATALVGAGALWGATAARVASGIARSSGGPASTDDAQGPTWPQRYRRWRRSLRQRDGWQYPVRLTAALLLATAAAAAWGGPHATWIVVTAAVLVERPVERWPVRTTQRALGAASGVALAGVLLSHDLPAWTLIAIVAVLAALRPLLRARNYLLYTVAMTPLILLMLEGGRTIETRVLGERVLATLVGAAIVLTVNGIASAGVGARSQAPT